ncbi:hypothetical protein HMPREF9402_2864 [Turicibacter sp. HGF1]|nr:hypothetical protein HMPREF9402_2864 [Turicibacter sp. HGF1]
MKATTKNRLIDELGKVLVTVATVAISLGVEYIKEKKK